MAMTIGEALDHVRSYNTRLVKPFAQLEGVLEVVVEVAQTMAAKQQALDAVIAQIGIEQARHEEMTRAGEAVEAATSAARARQSAAEQEATAAEGRLVHLDAQHTQAVQAQDRRLEQLAEAARGALDKQLAGRRTQVAALQAQIEDLRRTLAELRARFNA